MWYNFYLLINYWKKTCCCLYSSNITSIKRDIEKSMVVFPLFQPNFASLLNIKKKIFNTTCRILYIYFFFTINSYVITLCNPLFFLKQAFWNWITYDKFYENYFSRYWNKSYFRCKKLPPFISVLNTFLINTFMHPFLWGDNTLKNFSFI